jgi:hypothetical protein
MALGKIKLRNMPGRRENSKHLASRLVSEFHVRMKRTFGRVLTVLVPTGLAVQQHCTGSKGHGVNKDDARKPAVGTL